MRLFCGGGSRGRAQAGSPSCLDQTAARRAPKKFLNDTPPPLISGSRWPPPPPPYLEVWIRHCSVQVILTLDSTFSGYQPWRPGHMGVLFRSCQQLYQALPLQQQFLRAHPLLPDQVILTVLQQKHFISISLVPYSSCILMGIYTQHLTK